MKQANRFFYGWVIVFASFLIALTTFGVQYSFGVFFKPIQDEFHWSRTVTSGVASVYLLFHGAFSIPLGMMADKYGPRVVLSMAGLLFGTGLLLTSQLQAPWQLYIYYSLMVGVAVSGAYSPLISNSSRWFVKRRGLTVGIIAAGIGVGIMVMSPLNTLLITNFGWRQSYLILGVSALIIVIGSAQFLVRDPSRKGLMPYGAEKNPGVKITGINEKQPAATEVQYTFSQAVHTKTLWLLASMHFCVSLVHHMVMVHLVPFATDKGIPAASAAFALGLIGMGSIFGKLVGGVLTDKIGGKKNFVIVVIIQALSVMLLFTPVNTALLLAFALIFGFCYGGWVPQFAIQTSHYFGLKNMTAIYGVILLGASIGSSIGPLTAGYIYDITGKYPLAFVMGIAVLIIAILLALQLKPKAGTMR